MENESQPLLLPEVLTPGEKGNDGPPADGGGKPSLLLVGPVDFGAAPGAVAARERGRWAARGLTGAKALRSFAPLPATREEVAAVRDSFEQRFVSGSDRLYAHSRNSAAQETQIPP